MTNFVTDNTDLYDDKIDPNPVTVPRQQWGADDAALVKQALLDLRGVVQSTPTSITTADLNLVANTLPTVGPELDWVGYNGNWFVGVDVANAPTSRDFVMTGVRSSYAIQDGVTTSASPTLTSASEGGFTTAMIGAVVSGAGIPVGTTVIGVGGLTTLAMSANATATAGSVRVRFTQATVRDLAYWRHRGSLSPTLGLGVTPPDGSARLQVSAQDDEPTMGTVRFRVGPTQTGKGIVLHDSTPTDRWWVDKDFYVSGSHPLGGAMVIQSTPATPGPTDARALMMTDSAKSSFYAFTFPGASVMRIRYISGGFDILDFQPDGGLRHASTKLGFYNSAAITKPAVTGSRAGNAALASLLTQLANLGLITDSTTA